MIKIGTSGKNQQRIYIGLTPIQMVYEVNNLVWSKPSFAPIEYGLLYSFAVCEDSRNIAPPGWHLPTWDEIINNLRTFVNSPDGSAYKEVGLAHWNAPNNGTDAHGLKIIPSGVRLQTSFSLLKDSALFWTGTHDLWSPSVYSGMFWSVSQAQDIYNYKNSCHYSYCPGYMGMALRFVKDDNNNEGLMTDNDGHIYPTVKINNLVFTALNHRGMKFRNGDSIPVVGINTSWQNLTTPVCCRYEP